MTDKTPDLRQAVQAFRDTKRREKPACGLMRVAAEQDDEVRDQLLEMTDDRSFAIPEILAACRLSGIDGLSYAKVKFHRLRQCACYREVKP